MMTIVSSILYLVFNILFLVPAPAAFAENMDSDSYKLRMTNLNMTSGSKSSDNYNILDTVGQTAPGQSTSSAFYVKAGFPYIKTIIPFSFTISDLSIDFGPLSANNPVSKTNTLTVSFGGAGGYSVTAFENHPLKLLTSSTTIPDTTCDDESCTEVVSAAWSQNSTTGFGFTMSGFDVPDAFSNGTKYKQFADLSAVPAETPQAVMSSANVGKDRIATVTYKVNISGTQAAGNYENAITFIAIPTY